MIVRLTACVRNSLASAVLCHTRTPLSQQRQFGHPMCWQTFQFYDSESGIKSFRSCRHKSIQYSYASRYTHCILAFEIMLLLIFAYSCGASIAAVVFFFYFSNLKIDIEWRRSRKKKCESNTWTQIAIESPSSTMDTILHIYAWRSNLVIFIAQLTNAIRFIELNA